jgi:hypothetical protein
MAAAGGTAFDVILYIMALCVPYVCPNVSLSLSLLGGAALVVLVCGFGGGMALLNSTRDTTMEDDDDMVVVVWYGMVWYGGMYSMVLLREDFTPRDKVDNI